MPYNDAQRRTLLQIAQEAIALLPETQFADRSRLSQIEDSSARDRDRLGDLRVFRKWPVKSVDQGHAVAGRFEERLPDLGW